MKVSFASSKMERRMLYAFYGHAHLLLIPTHFSKRVAPFCSTTISSIKSALFSYHPNRARLLHRSWSTSPQRKPLTFPKAPIPKFFPKMNCPIWTGGCSILDAYCYIYHQYLNCKCVVALQLQCLLVF